MLSNDDPTVNRAKTEHLLKVLFELNQDVILTSCSSYEALLKYGCCPVPGMVLVGTCIFKDQEGALMRCAGTGIYYHGLRGKISQIKREA
jgi:hypothetical protein